MGDVVKNDKLWTSGMICVAIGLGWYAWRLNWDGMAEDEAGMVWCAIVVG